MRNIAINPLAATKKPNKDIKELARSHRKINRLSDLKATHWKIPIDKPNDRNEMRNSAELDIHCVANKISNDEAAPALKPKALRITQLFFQDICQY
jgi:hypothetical protein